MASIDGVGPAHHNGEGSSAVTSVTLCNPGLSLIVSNIRHPTTRPDSFSNRPLSARSATSSHTGSAGHSPSPPSWSNTLASARTLMITRRVPTAC
jgi:hypothetical protein